MKLAHIACIFSLLSVAVIAGCSKNTSSTPGTPTTTCTVTAGAASVTMFGPEGGTGTVAVTASGSGCTWTATSNAAFITISQGATGTTSGTVQFTVAPNTSGERTGNIVVASTTIAITQRAAPAQVTLGAPTPVSPAGGQVVDSARPALTVTNATATGNPSAVTYRFEISDQSSFPDNPVRTFFVDGVPQGSGGTTTGTIARDLGPAVTWFWRARASAGSVTGAYSSAETFRTAPVCSYTLSSAGATVAGGASNIVVSISTTPGCTWTATSNASFVTVVSGASGSGDGTITLAVSANSTGSGRSGTVTIGGQTFTVTQGGGGIVVSFQLIDPSTQSAPTTECRIRSLTSQPTTCVLESTSFPLGPAALVDFAWTVEYTYVNSKTVTQTGSNPRITFSELCGQGPATAEGFLERLTVTLTVTDSLGAVVTATSGVGSQPALFLRYFTCGI